MKKCPLDILGSRPISFVATYTKNSIFHICPKGKSKSPKLNSGDSYWLPESYRVVNKFIQYLDDFPYKKEEPKWLSPKQMTEQYSRYWITIKSIKDTTIQKLDKSHAIGFGIPHKSNIFFRYKDEIKPKKFKKSEELWRLNLFLNDFYSLKEDAWDSNLEIWLYEYLLFRKNPKFPNFLDYNLHENSMIAST